MTLFWCFHRLRSEHLCDVRLDALLSVLQSADSLLRELSLVCVSSANTPIPYDLFGVLGLGCRLQTLRSVTQTVSALKLK